jgi:predicted DNA binding CopG/RHH family protein
MATKRFASSVRGRRAERNEKPIPDRAIDFSDLPESTDEELRRARRVGRPRSSDAKLLIAIRIRSSLLAKIRRAAKEEGKPYKTLIHEILEKRMKHIR